MIFSLEDKGTNIYNTYTVSCWKTHSEFLGFINLMFLHHYDYHNSVWFFYLSSYSNFFFFCNNYPESITSAPRNLDQRIEDDMWKLTTVCLLYMKGLAEKIQRICSPNDIRTIFTSCSNLWRQLFHVKPPTEYNMIKNSMYFIPCSCGNVYKGETWRPLKIRLNEHPKAVVCGEIGSDGPYMEGKGKQSALRGQNSNN